MGKIRLFAEMVCCLFAIIWLGLGFLLAVYNVASLAMGGKYMPPLAGEDGWRSILLGISLLVVVFAWPVWALGQKIPWFEAQAVSWFVCLYTAVEVTLRSLGLWEFNLLMLMHAREQVVTMYLYGVLQAVCCIILSVGTLVFYKRCEKPSPQSST